jgi:hypothetical protein
LEQKSLKKDLKSTTGPFASRDATTTGRDLVVIWSRNGVAANQESQCWRVADTIWRVADTIWPRCGVEPLPVANWS